MERTRHTTKNGNPRAERIDKAQRRLDARIERFEKQAISKGRKRPGSRSK
jgi:hypothetical protein